MANSSKKIFNIYLRTKSWQLGNGKLAGFETKSWKVFDPKVGKFYPKKRVPALTQKFIARLVRIWPSLPVGHFGYRIQILRDSTHTIFGYSLNMVFGVIFDYFLGKIHDICYILLVVGRLMEKRSDNIKQTPTSGNLPLFKANFWNFRLPTR